MRNFLKKQNTESKSKPSLDTGSEIYVMRTTGGGYDKDHKIISVILKSKTETIDSLLKKLPGVI